MRVLGIEILVDIDVCNRRTPTLDVACMVVGDLIFFRHDDGGGKERSARESSAKQIVKKSAARKINKINSVVTWHRPKLRPLRVLGLAWYGDPGLLCENHHRANHLA